MASWETDSRGWSYDRRPDICSGEYPALSPSTTYLLTNPFLSRSFLPRSFLFPSARSWASLGRYDRLSGIFLLISPETDDGLRPRTLAISRTPDFRQSSVEAHARSRKTPGRQSRALDRRALHVRDCDPKHVASYAAPTARLRVICDGAVSVVWAFRHSPELRRSARERSRASCRCGGT